MEIKYVPLSINFVLNSEGCFKSLNAIVINYLTHAKTTWAMMCHFDLIICHFTKLIKLDPHIIPAHISLFKPMSVSRCVSLR